MDQGPGFDLGARLKALRESHDLSQRELAKRAGVSNAIISMIEQNRSSPSVGLLKKLLAGCPVSYRQVSRDLTGKAMQILHEHYRAGADTGEQMLTHDAEEGGVIIRGRLEVTVGDQVRVLGPGDAYYFDSKTPHRFKNAGTE